MLTINKTTNDGSWLLYNVCLIKNRITMDTLNFIKFVFHYISLFI